HLATMVVLGPDGRPLPRPDDPEAARQFDEIRRYIEDVQIRLPFIKARILMLRERRAWDESLILQALRSGGLFPDEVVRAIQPGVRAYEAGRHWEALHVLIPQVERVIRELALGLQVPTYRYSAATGELQWLSLDTFLRDATVEAILAKARPDWAREL